MTRWTIGLLICGVSIAASYYFIDRRLLISLKAHRSSGMGLSWMTAIGFLSSASFTGCSAMRQWQSD
jgi:hypothetical protein